MAYNTAQILQDKLAGVAPMAGLVFRPIWDDYFFKKPLPFCIIHGTADSTVGVQGDAITVPASESIARIVATNGASPDSVVTQLPDINSNDGSSVTKIFYPGKTTAGDVVFYRINNGGHSVQGIEPEANQDINSYEAIWSFFKDRNRKDR